MTSSPPTLRQLTPSAELARCDVPARTCLGRLGPEPALLYGAPGRVSLIGEVHH